MRKFHSQLLLKNHRGFILMKVMVGIVVITIIVLMDLQRQKQNLIASRNRQSKQAIVDFAASLQNWLGHPDTFSYSFGANSSITAGGLPSNRRKVALYQSAGTVASLANIAEREQANIADRATNNNDKYSINHLVLFDGSSGSTLLRLGTATPGGVPMIGPPDGTSRIKSLDSAGWVYIRSMWIDEFDWYDAANLGVGNAELKILIWRFTNLLDRPGQNCLANNNCLTKVISVPIDIEVSSDGTDILIERGTYGLKCGDVSDVQPNTNTCLPGQLFQKLQGIDDPSPGIQVNIYRGRCCTPINPLELL